MAGFSLRPTTGEANQQNPSNQISPESLYLYKNEEILAYNKELQLWQQQQHLQRQYQQQQQGFYANISSSDEFAATSSSRGGVNTTMNMMMRSSSSSQGGGGGSGERTVSCQDCGNQAKKDCVHTRCRTCCKSRGFDCQTHVKSTWVPASRRRERLQQHHQPQQLQLQPQPQQQRRGMMENTKRPRENLVACTTTTTTATATTSRLPSHTSGLEVGQSFPAEVSSPAVFRCVRVSAMDEADEQYAYQTAVNIGGHVFKGILYDQGLDNHPHQHHYGGGESSSGGGGGGGRDHHHQGHQQHGNLITSSSTAAAAASPLFVDPSSAMYPTPLNAFLAGTQFFPHPRS